MLPPSSSGAINVPPNAPNSFGATSMPPSIRGSERVDEVELRGASDHEPTVLPRPADVEDARDLRDRGPGMTCGRGRGGVGKAGKAEQRGRDQAHRGAHPISTSRLKNSYDEIR